MGEFMKNLRKTAVLLLALSLVVMNGLITYADEAEVPDEPPEYICGLDIHHHTDECYEVTEEGTPGELICTMQEHQHNEECIAFLDDETPVLPEDDTNNDQENNEDQVTEDEDASSGCKIGETSYDTLSDAVKAIFSGEAAGNIELLSDQILDVGNIDKDVRIIGNGHAITVPMQTTTSDSESQGRLNVRAEITFDNCQVNFYNEYQGGNNTWSLVMSKSGTINFVNGSNTSFTKFGIYTEPGAEINVNHSTMKLSDMQYTCMMAEAYATLNVTNGSNFVIKNSVDPNGLTGFKINVDASSFSVSDCQNQGLVKCDLILSNGADANISNNHTGYNMYSNNVLIVNEGTTLTMNENLSRALMMQGKGQVTVKSGGTMTVQRNGSKWNASDDETKHYATKSAITIGVYGWFEGAGKIYLYKGDVVAFEDGADVNVSNNYVRGISNFGTLNVGNTTAIMNNGDLKSGETAEDCRVATGGGIYNRNIMTVAEGAKLYNNHANTEADDLYNEAGGTVSLCSVGSDWSLDSARDCADQITGWFDDAAQSRWEAHEQPQHVEQFTGSNITEAMSLKAAHGILYRVTYDLSGGTYNGSETVDPKQYAADTEVNVIDDPLRTGYTFAGWIVTTDNKDVAAPAVDSKVFAMPAANVHLKAKWTENAPADDPNPPVDPPYVPVDPIPPVDPPIDPPVDPDNPQPLPPDENLEDPEEPDNPTDNPNQQLPPDEHLEEDDNVKATKSENPDQPKTGDESQLALYLLLVAGAGGTLALTVRRKRTSK